MPTKWFNDENFDLISPIMVNWGKDTVTVSQDDMTVVLTEQTITQLIETLCKIVEEMK